MLAYRPGTVVGTINGTQRPAAQFNKPKPSITKPPEQSIPRAINYLADYSGCGYWRMVWPSHLVTAYQKVITQDSTCMVRDDMFYNGIKTVRLQRQANPQQLRFYKEICNMARKKQFNVIYEIDDIVLSEDIPDYNKYKFAFEPKEIRNSVIEMMQMSHEITVTCEYMKDYYISKTGNKNVTVIPNYPPRFWLDGFYDEDKLSKNYDRHVKKRHKPRILYAGSGAHFDVDNKTGMQDDFTHVRDIIRKTTNKYQWVFVGGYPPPLHDLVSSGKIEFIPWCPLYDLPRLLFKLNINCMVAPLTDNTFNRCKSDIKYVEACAYGIPIVCQDMITYKSAPFKFNTGSEMIDNIADILKDKTSYMKLCRKARLEAELRWLENNNNLGKYVELYTLPYGDPKRKLLNSFNNI